MPVIYDHAPLRDRVRANLAKEYQHKAIMAAQNTIMGKRDRLVAQNKHWEDIRTTATAIRERVLNDLDYYVREFAQNAQARGCQLHFARSDEAATDIALGIMQEVDATACVKAKSILTEEIGLNEKLAKHGIEAIETDCAEIILQAAGSPPSHIVVPALHFDRTSIRDLFRKTRGYEGSDDPEEITRFLRAFMRPSFLSAKVGVCGCNFGVADTGSVTLVTNEGNGRMVTTFPETLIVVMGIERIVPDLASLDAMMQLLVPSAVGSKITSSFTLNTGPRHEGEADGPRTVHVIMVDNGRSAILGSRYRDALRCIHCGACMNTCPVYRHITGHGYGSVYPGPIGVVMTPLLTGYEASEKLPNACTLCAACAEVCPMKIPLNNLILDHRNDMVDGGYVGAMEKFAFKTAGRFLGSRSLYGLMAGVGRAGTKVMGGSKGRMSAGTAWVPVLKGWTASRDLDHIQKTFRSQFAARKAGGGAKASDAQSCDYIDVQKNNNFSQHASDQTDQQSDGQRSDQANQQAGDSFPVSGEGQGGKRL